MNPSAFFSVLDNQLLRHISLKFMWKQDTLLYDVDVQGICEIYFIFN